MLSINFSPLKNQNFKVSIFRKEKMSNEKRENFPFAVQLRVLPENDSTSKEKRDYWVSFEPVLGFSECTFEPYVNIGLSISYLNYLVESRCREIGLKNEEEFFVSKFKTENNNKTNKIYFVNKKYDSGSQCVWVKADYLDVTKQFGFYFDFHFKKNPESKNFFEIQKLSLSLNSKGFANTDYYADRYDHLKKFAEAYYKKVFKNTTIDFNGLQELKEEFLNNKVYQFKDIIEGYNATDLKQKKPYQKINGVVKIYFPYKQSEKYLVEQAINKIKNMLLHTFETNANCIPCLIETNSIVEIKKLIEKIKSEDLNSNCLVFLPVQNEKVNYYYQCKYEFEKENIPIQFTSYKTLKSNNDYAYDGITLQIFAKLGGKPWKMKPTNDKCLIIGLSQANPKRKYDNKSPIKRFFGYSVLVDSSGIYKSLEVFSNELSKDEYLNSFKMHLCKIIEEHKREYNKIVIHTPFRIKEEELKAIHTVINEAQISGMQFAVIRINIKNDYFAYNKQRNSLVVFESSLLKISENKYLIWFEGLKRNTEERPNKRFSGPTFIEFHYPEAISENEKLSYIQDIINLSGGNWRGFKAKAEPISIYYCYLVTQFIKQFREIGYEKIRLNNFKPWFL